MSKHDKHKDHHKHESHTEVKIENSMQAETSTGADLEELENDLKRVQAEFLNFKRRNESERAELIDMVKQTVIMELLPLLDNISRALTHLPAELEANDWARGVVQVGKQADDTLTNLGVTKVESVGQPFDPNLHEAVAMEEGDGKDEVVVEELQSGYKIGDKVLRPAMVKVGKQ